jgi:hypothetical protein
MAVYGISIGLFTFFFFSRLVRAIGERTLFLVSIGMFAILFILYSITSIVVRKLGFGIVVYALLGAMLLAMAVADMAFGSFSPASSGRVHSNSRPFFYIGSIFMFVTASPPNKRMLGATFGLSVVRPLLKYSPISDTRFHTVDSRVYLSSNWPSDSDKPVFAFFDPQHSRRASRLCDWFHSISPQLRFRLAATR